MIDKLAKLPLRVQPGTDWRYGPSVNIQGYIVEKLSGKTLDEYFRTKIFEPLGMKDTGFWVDPSKKDRVTNIHTYGRRQEDHHGAGARQSDAQAGVPLGQRRPAVDHRGLPEVRADAAEWRPGRTASASSRRRPWS